MLGAIGTTYIAANLATIFPTSDDRNPNYPELTTPNRHPLVFVVVANAPRSYLYYCPFTGDRVVLPVNVFARRTPPPPFKQLRVHPDGGMGPIPLYTGWTLGPVPKHVAAWASAAKRSSADLDSSAYGRPRSGTGGGEGGGVAELAGAVAAVAAEKERGDALLASIAAAQPGARLPLVPEVDETFVSRDTYITGRSFGTQMLANI